MLSPKKMLHTKSGRIIPTVLATMLLASCSMTKFPFYSSSTPTDVDASSAYYMEQMQSQGDSQKADWQLLAIRASIREGNLAQANQLFNTLPTTLSNAQRSEQQLVGAELNIAENKLQAARRFLSNLNTNNLNATSVPRYYQAVITASQGEEASPALLRAYIYQETQLSNGSEQKNIDDTWRTLTALKPNQLNQLAPNAKEKTLSGWIDLRKTYELNGKNVDTLKSAINNWQTTHPEHPAVETLPTTLQKVLTLQSTPITKIALLLPMNGQAKVFSDAIKTGFDDARSSQLSTTPSDVKVYDTSGDTPLSTLLSQAENDGATMAIGPLLKDKAAELASNTVSTSMNVLVLNQPEQIRNSNNLCFFALSPEDEARNAARHIWSQNKHSPILLVPGNDLGNRVVKAFSQQWTTLGGGTVLQQNFSSADELNTAIKAGALHLPTPTTTGTTENNQAGVDAIYIVANIHDMEMIKPVIDQAKADNKHVALYASSRSNSSGTTADYRAKMEGLQFSDVPLLSGSQPAQLQKAIAKLGNDFSLIRLYAMGQDTWALANQFAQMRQIPSYQIAGASGVLSADNHCVINRNLTWLHFYQGIVSPM